MPEIGHGTQLLRNTTEGLPSTVSQNFVVVAQVFDLVGPSPTRDDVEVTNYQSSDGYREYIPGLKEPGSVTFTMNFLSSNITQQQLFHSSAMQTTAGVQGSTNAVVGSFNSTAFVDWRIVGPNNDYWQFSGYVSGVTQSQPIDDRRTWEATLKVRATPKFGHTT